ncbi:MAG TPA: hypothetical protein VFF14_06365 [Candidatus Deferrimicrobium sp.]|nr:hypothetical protein [Candidatus Deferrimicrobium sp.]
MEGSNGFKLEGLLETIAEELKQAKQESQTIENEEYSLTTDLCEQKEAIPGKEQDYLA